MLLLTGLINNCFPFVLVDYFSNETVFFFIRQIQLTTSSQVNPVSEFLCSRKHGFNDGVTVIYKVI